MRNISAFNKNTLKPYVKAFIQNKSGSVSASTIGKELKARLPMYEWAVLSYEHSSRQGDKRKVNWTGDYIKVRVPADRSLAARHHLIVSFFKRSDAGLGNASRCRSNIIAYNVKNDGIWRRTQQHSSKRQYLPDLCPGIAKSATMAWASHRTGAKIRTFDPLSVTSTAPGKLKNYGAERVKYMIVGGEYKQCAGVQPDFKKIAGIGAIGGNAMFLTTGGTYHLYSRKREANCFTSRGLTFDSDFSVFTEREKVVALPDTRPFDDMDDAWDKNYVLLSDGTYRSIETYAGSEKPVESGDLTDLFSGLTQDHARMIVGATTIPSKGTVYFFFKDGTYSRYDMAKGRVVFGPYPTDKGWSGVKAKNIIGVAEFEKYNDAVYFFYDDGQYAKYKISQRQVVYNGAASGWK